MRNPFRYFNSSPEIIRLTVMMYVRYPLSLRQVEDLLFERGIDICHETVRFWWNWFGPTFAAMKVIGNAASREYGGRLNNRAEISHQPLRRREGAMLKFRDLKTLQKFASVHASIHDRFNLNRHRTSRETFKQDRAATLVE